MKAFTRTNLLLLAAVVALAVAPLALGVRTDPDRPYAGTDSLAEQRITEDHPDYRPWFSSIYQPPSAEIESALFALQAAIGAGVLGYYFGVARTRRRLAAEAVPATTRTSAAGPDPGTAPGTGDGSGRGDDRADGGTHGGGPDAGAGAAH